MKCKTFRQESRISLEEEINRFIQYKEDVRISLSSNELGNRFYYTAIVYWKENNG